MIEATHDALKAAAQRRGLSLIELYDELTPDFGLGGEGLVLEVGPQRYRLQLQGDLSLRVVGDKGKASKTLPALRTNRCVCSGMRPRPNSRPLPLASRPSPGSRCRAWVPPS